MKHLLLIFLLTGSLICPAWGQDRSMTLEELIQKIEKAKPWTLEKVEAELGVKFTYTSSTGVVKSHTAYEALPSVKDLSIEYVSIDILEANNKTRSLSISIDTKSSCFALEQVKRIYPKADLNPFHPTLVGGGILYINDLPWGNVTFESYLGCMMMINVSNKEPEKKQ